MGIEVDLEKCTGCKKCVLACPFGVIELVEKKARINYDECTICGACANACEDEAIIIERGAGKGTENIEEYKGALVFAEQHDGEMKKCSYELLGEGRKLADITQQMKVVVFSSHLDIVFSRFKTAAPLSKDMVPEKVNHFHSSVNGKCYKM